MQEKVSTPRGRKGVFQPYVADPDSRNGFPDLPIKYLTGEKTSLVEKRYLIAGGHLRPRTVGTLLASLFHCCCNLDKRFTFVMVH